MVISEEWDWKGEFFKFLLFIIFTLSKIFVSLQGGSVPFLIKLWGKVQACQLDYPAFSEFPQVMWADLQCEATHFCLWEAN